MNYRQGYVPPNDDNESEIDMHELPQHPRNHIDDDAG